MDISRWPLVIKSWRVFFVFSVCFVFTSIFFVFSNYESPSLHFFSSTQFLKLENFNTSLEPSTKLSNLFNNDQKSTQTKRQEDAKLSLGIENTVSDQTNTSLFSANATEQSFHASNNTTPEKSQPLGGTIISNTILNAITSSNPSKNITTSKTSTDTTTIITPSTLLLSTTASTTTTTILTTETSTTETISTTTKPKDEFNFASSKKILFYNSYFHWKDHLFGFGNEPFISQNCPVRNCFTTDNRSLLDTIDKFDALVFHSFGMSEVPKIASRNLSQRYIMFLMECPLMGQMTAQLNDFFNWTFTYRLDSDFSRPYGWIVKINSSNDYPPSSKNIHDLTYPRGNEVIIREIEDNLKEKNKNKKLIAWLVSNCNSNSQREVYVKGLQKILNVDVYGRCGTLQCEKIANTDTKCMEMLDKEYKFYLSFENSLCADYVTEKLWKVLHLSIVPIVLGGSDYTRIAPEHSYINAQNFENPSHLAEYILYLNNNDTAYAEYFEWKRYFRVTENQNKVFCDICKALNDPNYPKGSYKDLNQWWVQQGNCTQKGNFPWSNSKK